MGILYREADLGTQVPTKKHSSLGSGPRTRKQISLSCQGYEQWAFEFIESIIRLNSSLGLQFIYLEIGGHRSEYSLNTYYIE